VPLPGGNFAWDTLPEQVARAQAAWPFLEADEARRLVLAYGTRIERVLGGAKTREELGASFGGGLSEAEVRYLMREEWAETPDDVLWRRSKLGLQLSQAETEALGRFMAGARGPSEPVRPGTIGI
jgi:glycerol-3-phosphate dehydrogenase